MSYYARVIFHPCTLSNFLLYKYFHSKPIVVEQGFPLCYPESVWRKIHKQQNRQGQSWDLVWQCSESQFTSSNSSWNFSQFHNPWEDEEGCVVWGTSMSQEEAFCSWACDWLYGHPLCCILTKRKWKVILGFARMLRGSWSVWWTAWAGS